MRQAFDLLRMDMDTMHAALRAFVAVLRNRRVRIFTDNQNVPRVQRKGSAVPALGLAAKQLDALTTTENITLTVEWIPRELNTLADPLSKNPDKDDWQLSPRLFAVLDQIWGPHDLDAFASAQNALLPKFWSRSQRRVPRAQTHSSRCGPV